jgi:maleate cis-trans isomerase
MYGWRARLGVLVPSGILATEPEYGKMTPEGALATTIEYPSRAGD